MKYFYSRTRKGAKLGPVSGSKLRELARTGDLLPTDLIWPEGSRKPAKAATANGLIFLERQAGSTTIAQEPGNGVRSVDSDADDGAEERKLARPAWSIFDQGPPFRGLDVFEFEHAPIFFGRETESLAIRSQLREQARNGCAFVLIRGESAIGKSSLARAGVLPDICKLEIDSEVRQWRRLAIKPSQLGRNPVRGFVAALAGRKVLPEFAQWKADLTPPDDAGEFPEWLERFGLRLSNTLDEAGDGRTRLVILLDQLEELFTIGSLPDESSRQLLDVLETMARSGRVWVLAAVRSDFDQECQKVPVLQRMKEGRGQFDLLPPASDALCRMVNGPASLAGLHFERKGGILLSDVIAEEAAGLQNPLPLVEILLLELCERRTDEGELTFAAYREAGGVEGALRQRCEVTFGKLSASGQDALDRVLSKLVRVGGDGRATCVCRTVPLDSFAGDSYILDSIEGESAAPSHWRESRGPGTATLLTLAAVLITAGIFAWYQLNEAESAAQALESRIGELTAENSGLQNANRSLENQNVDLRSAKSDLEEVNRNLENRSVDLLSEKSGLEEVNQKLAIQRSRQLMVRAWSLFSENDVSGCFALLAEAVAISPGSDDDANSTSVNLFRQQFPVSGFWNDARSAAFSPDGQSIIVGERSGLVSVWTKDGIPIDVFEGMTSPVVHALFSPDGKRIAASSESGAVWVWSIGDTTPVAKWEPGQDQEKQDKKTTIRFLDGETLLIADAGRLITFDVRTSATIATRNVPEFNPVASRIGQDGKLLSTNDKCLRVSELLSDTANTVSVKTGDGLDISADGSYVSLVNDGLVEVWNLSGAEPVIESSHSQEAFSAGKVALTRAAPKTGNVAFLSQSGEAFLLTTVLTEEGPESRVFQYNGPIVARQFDFTSDGNYLIISGSSRLEPEFLCVQLVSANTGKLSPVIRLPKGSLQINSNSDGMLLCAIQGRNDAAYLFDDVGRFTIGNDFIPGEAVVGGMIRENDHFFEAWNEEKTFTIDLRDGTIGKSNEPAPESFNMQYVLPIPIAQQVEYSVNTALETQTAVTTVTRFRPETRSRGLVAPPSLKNAVLEAESQGFFAADDLNQLVLPDAWKQVNGVLRGKYVLACNDELERARVWSLEKNAFVTGPMALAGRATGNAVFSPDGRFFLVVCETMQTPAGSGAGKSMPARMAQIWDVREGLPVSGLFEVGEGFGRFDNAGRYFVWAEQNRLVCQELSGRMTMPSEINAALAQVAAHRVLDESGELTDATGLEVEEKLAAARMEAGRGDVNGPGLAAVKWYSARARHTGSPNLARVARQAAEKLLVSDPGNELAQRALDGIKEIEAGSLSTVRSNAGREPGLDILIDRTPISTRDELARAYQDLLLQQIRFYTQAIGVLPDQALYLEQRAANYQQLGNLPAAIADYSKAIEIDPERARTYLLRGYTCNMLGEFQAAVADYREAAKRAPDDPVVNNSLAWILATCPEDECRNGEESLEYANRACELTEWKELSYFDALAAAHAELGNFDEAVKWQQKALGIENLSVEDRAAFDERLKLYEAKAPYREPTRECP
jgi:tetratricopeptide (TPR) repeat protein/WD40 repeat protein